MESSTFLEGTDRKSLTVSPDNRAFLSPEGSGVLLRREDLAVVFASPDARIPGLARKISRGAFPRTPPVLKLPERLEAVEGMISTGIDAPGRRLVVSSRNFSYERAPVLPCYEKVVMKRGANVPVRFFGEAFADPAELSSIRLEKGYVGHRMVGKHALVDETGKMLCRGDSTGTIPEGTEIILSAAFSNLDLHGLRVPEGVKEIEDNAFCGSNMGGSILLPASLERISSTAFREIRARRSLRLAVAKDNPHFTTDKSGKFLLRKEDGALLATVGRIERIPEEARILKDGSLDSCRARTLLIPATVDRVEPMAFKNSSLETLVVEGGLEKLAGVNFSRSFFKADKIHLKGPAKEIPASLFLWAFRVREVVLPEGLETIGARAFFRCRDLRSVQIPDSVRFIGSKAFAGTDLKDVLLPAGCQVAEDAFDEQTHVRFQKGPDSLA